MIFERLITYTVVFWKLLFKKNRRKAFRRWKMQRQDEIKKCQDLRMFIAQYVEKRAQRKKEKLEQRRVKRAQRRKGLGSA